MLEMLFDEKEHSNLIFILADMCPFTFKDKTCADPAIWQSWIDCCKKTNDKSFLKSEQILSVLVLCLKANESKYACFDKEGGNYSANYIIGDLSYLVNKGVFDKILDKVLNFKDYT